MFEPDGRTFAPLDRFAALRVLEVPQEDPLDRIRELLERMLAMQEARPPAAVSAAPA